ncbi:serine/threonine protein kinase, partial [bacterium]|nr:serine/threonine protein kinase [bacterium]
RVSGKTVALKLLHESIADTKDGLQRFLKEAEVGKLIHHPNVVKIYGAGSSETRRFITMEMVEGKTLKQAIREHGVFSTDDTKKIIIQIVEGLAQIHAHGVVHRDLKSDNIIIKPDGIVVIMDFGLARIKGMTSVAARDQLVGTLAYMSPEQTIGKEVDHRSDIYSLGVIAYEMLYGEMPFIANNEMELILAIHNETPPRLTAAVQTPCSEFVRICLAKNPEERFANMNMVMQFLNALAN